MIMHPRLDGKVPPGFHEWAESKLILKGRLGRPEDIAALGALLMSDDGSFITGQVISADGGSSMRL
jgi:NAD(P)-dependent dehydrogenase (short-subunit alcohol dehydrogenase family)